MTRVWRSAARIENGSVPATIIKTTFSQNEGAWIEAEQALEAKNIERYEYLSSHIFADLLASAPTTC